MTVEQIREELVRFGLDMRKDQFLSRRRGDPTVVICRSGVDKIEKFLKVPIKITQLSAIPYGDKCQATAIAEGGDVQAVGSANPDTSKYHYYSEWAAKRARHKVVLKLAGLYEHGVHSEDESDEFQRSAPNNSSKAVQDAMNLLK